MENLLHVKMRLIFKATPAHTLLSSKLDTTKSTFPSF